MKQDDTILTIIAFLAIWSTVLWVLGDDQEANVFNMLIATLIYMGIREAWVRWKE